MTPALLLAALTATAPPEPVCFASTVEASLFAGSYGEPLVSADLAEPGTFRLLFAGPRTWTEIVGAPGNLCIVRFGTITPKGDPA